MHYNACGIEHPPEVRSGMGADVRDHARKHSFQFQLISRGYGTGPDFLTANIQKRIGLILHQRARQGGDIFILGQFVQNMIHGREVSV